MQPFGVEGNEQTPYAQQYVPGPVENPEPPIFHHHNPKVMNTTRSRRHILHPAITWILSLTDPNAFRELQDQFAEIQEQIHSCHRHRSRHQESPFTDEITFTSIPSVVKLPRKDMYGFTGTEDLKDHLDTYLD
ncbi:hypothetical protein Ddye_018803 [Dipteronia dyeriana]|uniref:Uncharacterized protein n=1 Tax=Dipteronia dyeriana TaxID=168575 RepID=A0AAD9X163_9ROSI|nr:hypothetical protein Ddye_018803 [Dipteronia dyeriana]